MSPRTRRALLALLALVAAVAVGARIWWVNTQLPQIPVERHEVGEWVSLAGAFQDSASESADNYSLLLESAEVMTYDEYLSTYGDGEAAAGGHGDARCVLVVNLRVRNDAASEEVDQGHLNVFQTIVVPARGDEYLIADVMNEGALWPQTQQNAGKYMSVRPGTEYVMHIPYVFNGTQETYERDIVDTEFTLLVSRMPVRRLIAFSVDAG